MLTFRSPKEALSAALRLVDARIDKGMCFECAILETSTSIGVDRDKLEDLWIGSQIEE